MNLDHVDWQALRVRADIESSITGTEPDPGIQSWSGTAIYSATAEDYESDDFPRIDAYPRWDSAHDKGRALFVIETNGGEGAEWTVLEMDGHLVDMSRTTDSILDQLDSVSEDAANLSAIFDTDNDLHRKLQDMVEGGGSRAILIDRVQLAPAWRGLGGVGRLLISRILDLIDGNAAVVATIPFPIDLFDDPARPAQLASHPRFDSEMAKVRRTWESIAFEQFNDKIWVMDPAIVFHHRAVREIEKKLFGM